MYRPVGYKNTLFHRIVPGSTATCLPCALAPCFDLPAAFMRFLLPCLPVLLCGRRGVHMVGGRRGVHSRRDPTCG